MSCACLGAFSVFGSLPVVRRSKNDTMLEKERDDRGMTPCLEKDKMQDNNTSCLDSESYQIFTNGCFKFQELVALVSPIIERKNTLMRKAIPAAERIASTLRYLTTGETQSSLSYQFRIAQNTTSGIIPAVCAAIYHHLGSEIQVPESENEWKMVAEEFWAKWNFPLCLGAMDGKHIRINPHLLQELHTETTRDFSASCCWPL
ncbi:DDE Tnp4 domain-containing protein [Trichonephila clavipes]|nr:DDE Tnp4 domain-containing protein [Trichonephila clavipes]